MTLDQFFRTNENAESYLKWVKDWADPNPAPILEMHEDYLVVRDVGLKLAMM